MGKVVCEIVMVMLLLKKLKRLCFCSKRAQVGKLKGKTSSKNNNNRL